MDFGSALKELKNGKKVCRNGWNGKGMFVYKVVNELQFPPLPDGQGWKDDAFKSSEFIVMKTADSNLIPWLASQTDVLAEDWEVVTD